MNYKNKNQLMFFTALFLSSFGYEFIFFIMTLHIYDLSKSTLNIGIFTALTFAPKLLSPLAGGISDVLGKKKCFAISSLMISALFLYMSQVSSINIIYAIWLVASVFFTVIANARGALIAEVVLQEQYHSGNAFVLSLLNAAKLLGPFIGGLIAARLNVRLLLYFSCMIFIFAAICSIRINQIGGSGNTQKTSFWDSAKKGFKFMSANKAFRTLTLISVFWRLCLGLQVSLFVVYVKTVLGGSNEQYGLLITFVGVGSILGSLIGPFASKKVKPFILIPAGLFLHYLSFALLGFLRDFRLVVCLITVSYAVFYMTLVSMHSIRDMVTSSEVRGSAYGAVTAMTTPAAIVSMLAGSFLADRYGVSTVLILAGLTAIISLAFILISGRKEISSTFDSGANLFCINRKRV